MSKRKIGGDDEYDDNIASSSTSKYARGFLSSLPVEPAARPRNEALLSDLADRRCDRQVDASSGDTKHFADELATLNDRFVAFCQQAVHKDPHCFLFTGFNDYMEHFMGIFATYLAPLSDNPMTLICLQRLRSHCSSKFANVGKFVSQVKDASTSTDASIQHSIEPTRDSISLCSQMDRLRSTYDIARRIVPSSSARQATSSAGRRCREVMRAMQQMMHIQPSSRCPTTVSFAPVLLKNFNFKTANSSLKQSLSLVGNTQANQGRKYFNIQREGVSQTGGAELESTLGSPRIWTCLQCQTLNHIDCQCCSQCSGVRTRDRPRHEPVESLSTVSLDAPPKSQIQSTIELHSLQPASESDVQSSAPLKLVNGFGVREIRLADEGSAASPIALVSAAPGWTCSVCLVSNPCDRTACVCCTALRRDERAPSPDRHSPSEKPVQMWTCTICKKVQENIQSQSKCSSCGALKKATVGFKSPLGFSLSGVASSPFTRLVTPQVSTTTSIEKSVSEGCDDPEGEDDSQDMEAQKVDHCEKDALFASKCKMYYKHDDKYVLKSVGFVNVIYNDASDSKQLLFRADNFNGSTMLAAKVNPMMNPSIVKDKNVMLLTIAYPPFFDNQDVSKPLVVLFKMKSNEDANLFLNSLKEK